MRHLRGLANVIGNKILRTIWLSQLAYIQPHLVTRLTDTIDQLTDIADAIMETTRAPTFQIAEVARPPAFQPHNSSDAVVLEAKFELQLAQFWLSLQHEIMEQLAAIRRSIEAIDEIKSRRDHGFDRCCSRSHS